VGIEFRGNSLGKPNQGDFSIMAVFNLVKKNGYLFAIDRETDRFAGQVINNAYGHCVENPEPDHNFRRLYDGHGDIYEMSDHLFGVKSWGDIFSNPELLPTGTKQVFLDMGCNATTSYTAEYSN
jgi:hypothetical protein